MGRDLRGYSTLLDHHRHHLSVRQPMASAGAQGSGKCDVPDVSVDAVYEQVRVALGAELPSTERSGIEENVPGIRTLALRTPTLPPATHTACYLVGPLGQGRGPLMIVD